MRDPNLNIAFLFSTLIHILAVSLLLVAGASRRPRPDLIAIDLVDLSRREEKKAPLPPPKHFRRQEPR